MPTRGPIAITRAGAREGEHGVRVESPLARPIHYWYAQESEARQAFARVVDDLRSPRREGPAVALVQRVEKGRVVEDVFVARETG